MLLSFVYNSKLTEKHPFCCVKLNMNKELETYDNDGNLSQVNKWWMDFRMDWQHRELRIFKCLYYLHNKKKSFEIQLHAASADIVH